MRNGSVWFKRFWARVGMLFASGAMTHCEFCGSEGLKAGMLHERGYGHFCCDLHADKYIEEFRAW